MIKSKTFFAGASAALLLTACGSTGAVTDCVTTLFGVSFCETDIGTGDTNVSTSSNAGQVSADIVSFEYDDNGTPDNDLDDTIVITGADFDGLNGYSRDVPNDRGGMIAFQSDFQIQGVRYYAVVGESDSGALLVGLSATPDYIQEGDYYAAFSRNGTSGAPNVGNATYIGTYAGAATRVDGGGLILTEGLLSLEVEFGENGRVKGEVDNLSVTAVIDFDDVVIDDVEISESIVLNESTLDNGELYLGGTVTSFVSNESGGFDSTGNGTYVGAIGGYADGSTTTNASETAGYLEFTATATIGEDSVSLHEFGVFVGSCINGMGGDQALVCDEP